MNNFWQNLKRPIFVLAPMADVTDAAFRRIIAREGKPDVFYTEFVSADGLARAPEEGRQKLLKDLIYSESERPIVAQFFTSTPEYMEKAARLALELGFDGVDINMGCPDKTIEKQGAGAALIKNPKLAKELILAAQRGAPTLPISVKTRAGYNQVEIENWLPEILSAHPVVVTIHARTRKEMSKVPAQWEIVKRAVEIRDALKSETLIFGNGDVIDIDDAKRKCQETGCDGVMLGRAIFGNPWLFKGLSRSDLVNQYLRSDLSVSVREKLKVLVEHCKLFEEILGDVKNFAIMKKHFKAYIKDFDGSAELRGELMTTNSAQEVEEIVVKFLVSNVDKVRPL